MRLMFEQTLPLPSQRFSSSLLSSAMVSLFSVCKQASRCRVCTIICGSLYQWKSGWKDEENTAVPRAAHNFLYQPSKEGRKLHASGRSTFSHTFLLRRQILREMPPAPPTSGVQETPAAACSHFLTSSWVPRHHTLQTHSWGFLEDHWLRATHMTWQREINTQDTESPSTWYQRQGLLPSYSCGIVLQVHLHGTLEADFELGIPLLLLLFFFPDSIY